MNVKSLETQLEFSREALARSDLEYFTEWMGYPYPNAQIHKDWYHFLQYEFSPSPIPGAKKYLILWPRGHAKTECTSINYPTWLIGNDPNIHINIVTKTASLAESILGAIKQRIETDQNYIRVFGRLKPRDPQKWSYNQIYIRRDEISKNPTIKATGLMGPITGGRSDLVICDDIIDEENVRTRLQTEKVSTWFNKVLYPTLFPWGAILVIGTRWSYADLYAELLEKWPNQVYSAIQYDDKGKVTGVLWPEYWPLEKLEDRRKEIGTIFFNCQYMNDPTGMEGALLKAEWLQSWRQPPPHKLVKYAGVDPALGEGDKSAIATLSYDHHSRQGYLEDVWVEKIPLPQFLRKLNQLHILHKYAKIFLEANAFQKVLVYLPELRGLPIIPTQTVRDKEQRFIAMSSHYESGRVLVNPLIKNPRNEFYMEWIQFPRGQYDDGLDGAEIVTRNVLGKGSVDAWKFG